MVIIMLVIIEMDVKEHVAKIRKTGKVKIPAWNEDIMFDKCTAILNLTYKQNWIGFSRINPGGAGGGGGKKSFAIAEMHA